MKTVVIFAICIILSPVFNIQIERKLNLEQVGSGNYIVTPASNKTKVVGQGGPVIFKDEKIIYNQFSGIVNEVLSKAKQNSLQINTVYFITFNSKGEVLNCKFYINSKDLNILNEESLLKLYNRFMQVKIDMSNVKMGSYDYTETSISFASKEKRDLKNKEIEERRNSKH